MKDLYLYTVNERGLQQVRVKKVNRNLYEVLDDHPNYFGRKGSHWYVDERICLDKDQALASGRTWLLNIINSAMNSLRAYKVILETLPKPTNEDQ